jgi:hypothetical protein
VAKPAQICEGFPSREPATVTVDLRGVLFVSKLDLVNWTMREARQLSPEHHMDSEIERSPTLRNPLDVLEGERGGASAEDIRSIDINSVQFTVGSPIMRPAPEEPIPEDTSTLPARTEAAPANHRAIRPSHRRPF